MVVISGALTFVVCVADTLIGATVGRATEGRGSVLRSLVSAGVDGRDFVSRDCWN
jgi:hypothetical protein